MFKNNPTLYSKVVDLNSSMSSVSSNNSAISTRTGRSDNSRVGN
jgi:hypothetical protein